MQESRSLTLRAVKDVPSRNQQSRAIQYRAENPYPPPSIEAWDVLYQEAKVAKQTGSRLHTLSKPWFSTALTNLYCSGSVPRMTCPKCKADIPDASVFCLKCGQPVSAKLEAEEVSFYSDKKGVQVTNKRVIVKNKTYVLANITSVSSAVQKPDVLLPQFVTALGVALLLAGVGLLIGGAGSSDGIALGMMLWGVILGVAGYFWYRSCKPIFHLKIASASGESTPLQSENENRIKDICHAVNKAIIHRA